MQNKYLNEDRNGRVNGDSQHWLLHYTESSGVARKISWRISSSKECLFACHHKCIYFETKNPVPNLLLPLATPLAQNEIKREFV